ncbi:DUF4870 domain-containing protein [Mesonia sp. MT50]|uniref:DUF4870 domain-containing protein n=1 Tax=Mesonia profundi TaxID=3070998 RepID=A0ABU1A208_9FLAO|nr:DUF4870 domain-containing protein [Mesonia profundi]MDQ7917737.1 DUF4870 domain-containing protein [Mesonia profundi]
MPTIENKTWSVVTHASTFSKYFFPFGNLLIPLSILVIKKKEAFVVEQSKESLNFQLTIYVYYALWIGTSLIAALILGFNFGSINEFYFSENGLNISNTKDFILGPYLIYFAVVIITGLAIFLFDVLCVIQASISASEGKNFKYPLSLHILNKKSFLTSSSKNEQFHNTQKESL